MPTLTCGACKMFAYGVIMGPVTPVTLEYELTFTNGANLVTIPAMHGTDALCFVLGEFKHLQATQANHQPKAPIVDPASGQVLRIVDNDTSDYVSITGTLLSGAVATIVYQGGQPSTGKGLYWEIRGTKGSLIIEGPNGLVEMFPSTLKFVEQGGQPKDIEVEVAADWAYNVGKAWDAFASGGSEAVPTFDDALVRHRMIEAIHRSHEKGTREAYL
jgi:predicted dehydrogenase